VIEVFEGTVGGFECMDLFTRRRWHADLSLNYDRSRAAFLGIIRLRNYPYFIVSPESPPLYVRHPAPQIPGRSFSNKVYYVATYFILHQTL
jgi:hypothetical protein